MKYIALISILLLTSCGNTVDESKLSGKWVVEDLKVDAPELSPMLIEAARQDAISTIYLLNEDKSFVETSNSKPNGEVGFWRFRKEDNLLELVDEGVASQPYFIKSVNDNRMVWFQPMEGIGSLTIELNRVK